MSPRSHKACEDTTISASKTQVSTPQKHGTNFGLAVSGLELQDLHEELPCMWISPANVVSAEEAARCSEKNVEQEACAFDSSFVHLSRLYCKVVKTGQDWPAALPLSLNPCQGEQSFDLGGRDFQSQHDIAENQMGARHLSDPACELSRTSTSSFNSLRSRHTSTAMCLHALACHS